MASDTSLVFNLLAKDHVSPELAKISGSFASLGARIKSFAMLAAGGFAGLAIVGQIRGVIAAASDLSEAQNKIQVLFGEDTAAVQRWASSAANSMGMSTLAATDAAATMGVFGKSAGLTGQDLVKFSTQMAGLSSDFASFYNTSPEDAMQAIGAALRGESEPIRRYGILLDDATLRQRALTLGIVDSTKNALTPQQRVLAAQAEILAQSSAAQGDFARTSGGLANQQRILAAQITNVKAELGAYLLPIAVKLASFFTGTLIPVVGNLIELFVFGWKNGTDEFAGGAQQVGAAAHMIWDVLQNKVWPVIHDQLWPVIRDQLWPALQDTVLTIRDFVGWLARGSSGAQVVRAVLVGLTAAFIAWKIAVIAVSVATKIAAIGQWLWNVAMYANPIGLIILAVIALVAAIFYLWTHSEGFRNFFIGLWEHIWGFLKAVGAWFAGPFVDFFTNAWDNIVRGFTMVKDFVVGGFNFWVDFVRSLPGRIADAAVGMWNGLVYSFKSAVNWLIRLWNNFSLTLGGGSIFGMDIPSITLNTPDIPYLDTGGTILRTGLAVVHQGETVLPAGRGGGTEVHFSGDVDSAFATAFMKLVRTGRIRIAAGAVVNRP